jgi:hypothetical protein
MLEGYISREAAVKYIKSEQCRTCSDIGLCGNCAVLVAVKLLAKVPAADVAEVVRCKNCKWFADNNGGEWYGCQMFQVVQITPEDAPKPDDFCSYGEYQTNTGGVTK